VQQYIAQIAKATIVSPVDGIVVNRNLNPGEYPGARTLFTIQQLDRVYAELNASSTDTFTIPVGAPATITIADDMHPYHGKVTAVLGQVAPGSTNFIVKVLLSNPDGALQSGLPATASITLPAMQGPSVPTTAFLDNTHTSLMLVDDNGEAPVTKTVHVHEIASNSTTSIVTGIQVGDRIVSNGQLGIADGQAVRQE
jgi:RND family efflux transporter MFP subunit